MSFGYGRMSLSLLNIRSLNGGNGAEARIRRSPDLRNGHTPSFSCRTATHFHGAAHRSGRYACSNGSGRLLGFRYSSGVRVSYGGKRCLSCAKNRCENCATT